MSVQAENIAFQGIFQGGKKQAFCLMELLLALALTSMLLVIVVSVFYSNVKLNADCQGMLDMRQSIRACAHIMEREIRMAGYDPTGRAGAGILEACAESIAFSRDLNGDGDLTLSPGENDSNEVVGYGINSTGFLGRSTQNRYALPGVLLRAGRKESLSRDVTVVNFVYLDLAGHVLRPVPLSASHMKKVSAVLVTLGGRTFQRLRKRSESMEYKNLNGDVVMFKACSDSYGREVLGRRIMIRNRAL